MATVRDNTKDDCPSHDYDPGVSAGDCMTDGHYLCQNCKHRHPDLTEGYKSYSLYQSTGAIPESVNYVEKLKPKEVNNG